MKTDDLISLLATGMEPVPRNGAERRFALALGLGLPVAFLMMAFTLGIRSDLLAAMAEMMFWTKVMFAASLAVAALIATDRMSRPGLHGGRVWVALAAPLLLIWFLAATVWLMAAPAQRAELIFGSTWTSCPFNIAIISLPLLTATLWVVKGMAPTRLALAGACAGLLAGALSALLYALHCPESAAPFIAIWYVLGMALPVLAGTVLGPRVLRW